MQYEIHYQRPGDKVRVRRGQEGTTRRFTEEEAREFIRRNRTWYPNMRAVPVVPEAKRKVLPGRKQAHQTKRRNS